MKRPSAHAAPLPVAPLPAPVVDVCSRTASGRDKCYDGGLEALTAPLNVIVQTHGRDFVATYPYQKALKWLEKPKIIEAAPWLAEMRKLHAGLSFKPKDMVAALTAVGEERALQVPCLVRWADGTMLRLIAIFRHTAQSIGRGRAWLPASLAPG